MNGLHWYKAFPRDFLEGAAGMDLETKGAYRVLLDLIYMHDGRTPDDLRYVAGQLGCSVRKWRSIRECLISGGKIVVKDGVISNFRADVELKSSRSRREVNAENGSKSRKDKGLAQANAPIRAHVLELDTELDSIPPIVPLKMGTTKGAACDAKPRPRKSRVPTDWYPDQAGQDYATAAGCPDVAANCAAFVDHHVAKGTTFADHSAAWRGWCRNATKWGWAGANAERNAGTTAGGDGTARPGSEAARLLAASAKVGLEWDAPDKHWTD